jgi:putative tryptophan/tyrosine transport system substrate-binding protein
VKRRRFIALTGGAAVAWPVALRAQQPAVQVIGYLSSIERKGLGQKLLVAFRRGLAENSFAEGKNLTVEYRWAEGHYDRLPALASELVSRRVTVILVQGGPAAVVAKAATTTIPIVFSTGPDAVGSGLFDSLGRQSGNLKT